MVTMHRFDNQLLSIVSVESALRVSWRKKKPEEEKASSGLLKERLNFNPWRKTVKNEKKKAKNKTPNKTKMKVHL